MSEGEGLPDIEQHTAERILDALTIAIDGKISSAKTFSETAFEELADFDNWGQDANDSTKDTARTSALFLAYVIFSWGRIPLRGIKMSGIYFRPDLWVAGALVKKGYLTPDADAQDLVVTEDGWRFIASSLEGLSQ